MIRKHQNVQCDICGDEVTVNDGKFIKKEEIEYIEYSQKVKCVHCQTEYMAYSWLHNDGFVEGIELHREFE